MLSAGFAIKMLLGSITTLNAALTQQQSQNLICLTWQFKIKIQQEAVFFPNFSGKEEKLK